MGIGLFGQPDGEDEVVGEAPKKAPKKAEEPVVEAEDDDSEE